MFLFWSLKLQLTLFRCLSFTCSGSGGASKWMLGLESPCTSMRRWVWRSAGLLTSVSFFHPLSIIFRTDFFFPQKSSRHCRTTARPWRMLCLSCLSPRPTAIASAGAYVTRLHNSPRRRRSRRSLRLRARGLRPSTTCPWCRYWTSPTPLRPARRWQVKFESWNDSHAENSL